jgi:hypothetical protein
VRDGIQPCGGIEVKTAKLFSSCGVVVFDPLTGRVMPELTSYDDENLIVWVNVVEWRRRYPGEDVAAGHDILDFGLWYLNKKDLTTGYDPPCESWRQDREALRAPQSSNVNGAAKSE